MGRVSTAKGIEIMQRWLLGTAVALAMAAPATAADLPSRGPITKAPPPVAPIGYNWTGCYVGVNGGYGWSNGNTRYQNDPNAPNADPINFVPNPSGFPMTYLSAPQPRGSGGACWRWRRMQLAEFAVGVGH